MSSQVSKCPVYKLGMFPFPFIHSFSYTGGIYWKSSKCHSCSRHGVKRGTRQVFLMVFPLQCSWQVFYWSTEINKTISDSCEASWRKHKVIAEWVLNYLLQLWEALTQTWAQPGGGTGRQSCCTVWREGESRGRQCQGGRQRPDRADKDKKLEFYSNWREKQFGCVHQGAMESDLSCRWPWVRVGNALQKSKSVSKDTGEEAVGAMIMERVQNGWR